MTDSIEINSKRPFWFVNAASNEKDRYKISNDCGVWELFGDDGKSSKGYMRDQYLDHLKSMKIGDRIAIKAYKKPLEDENSISSSSNDVPTIYIVAIGTISKISYKKRKVWFALDNNFGSTARTWRYYRHHDIISCFKLGDKDYRRIALIRFAFQNARQDIRKFLGDSRYSKYADSQE